MLSNDISFPWLALRLRFHVPFEALKIDMKIWYCVICTLWIIFRSSGARVPFKLQHELYPVGGICNFLYTVNRQFHNGTLHKSNKEKLYHHEKRGKSGFENSGLNLVDWSVALLFAQNGKETIFRDFRPKDKLEYKNYSPWIFKVALWCLWKFSE